MPKNSRNAENGEISESEQGLVDFSKPPENEILKSRQLIANQNDFNGQARRTQKIHPFDLTPAELLDIKSLFPEFKQPRNISEHKLQGLPITKLRDALISKIKVPLELIDKIISRIDRRSDEIVYWNEFLNSLSD